MCKYVYKWPFKKVFKLFFPIPDTHNHYVPLNSWCKKICKLSGRARLATILPTWQFYSCLFFVFFHPESSLLFSKNRCVLLYKKFSKLWYRMPSKPSSVKGFVLTIHICKCIIYSLLPSLLPPPFKLKGFSLVIQYTRNNFLNFSYIFRFTSFHRFYCTHCHNLLTIIHKMSNCTFYLTYYLSSIWLYWDLFIVPLH